MLTDTTAIFTNPDGTNPTRYEIDTTDVNDFAMNIFYDSSDSFTNNDIYVYLPCSQHPAGQSFEDCFSTEWVGFCDGFISCLAQATNPLPIAAAIAIHCLDCTD